jgi:hypothetical protein
MARRNRRRVCRGCPAGGAADQPAEAVIQSVSKRSLQPLAAVWIDS